MRPTFMGFEAAKNAIYVNQKSIDIMGNNMSNVGTAGYTRQRVERAAVMSSNQANKIRSGSIGQAGQGVTATGVSQMRDSFLDKRFRDEYSNASYHGMAASTLGEIQRALGDGQNITDEAGLYGAISDMYKTLNDFIQEPTMDTQANLVMSSFKNITQVLKQLDNNLNTVRARKSEDMQVSVNRVNTIASELADTNRAISEDAESTIKKGSNELLDKRNLLLDELATYGDISISDFADGSISVKFGEHRLVDGSDSDSLILQKNQDDTVAITWRTSGENLKGNGGSLLAGIRFINGRGPNMNNETEEIEKGIKYYEDQLDTFASTLASTANSTVPVLDEATGEPQHDANGNIVYKQLIGNDDGSNAIKAENISLSKDWIDNGASYFIFNKDENVEDYARNLADKLTNESITFTSRGESYTGTFSDFCVNMVGNLGSEVKFHQGRQESYASVADDFLDQRDEVSGVNRDEETADMLKFQKSYEAAARLMTVLDDLLDVVINRLFM